MRTLPLRSTAFTHSRRRGTNRERSSPATIKIANTSTHIRAVSWCISKLTTRAALVEWSAVVPFVSARSKVMVPSSFGNLPVSPGFSCSDATPVDPPVSRVIVEVSNVYTQAPVPPLLPPDPPHDNIGGAPRGARVGIPRGNRPRGQCSRGGLEDPPETELLRHPIG